MKKGLRGFLCCLMAVMVLCSATAVFAAEEETGRSYVMPPNVYTTALGGTRYQIMVDHLYDARKVEIPTWSDSNGQDDVVWYRAGNEGNGVWTAVVDTAPHGGGLMYAHVYADDRVVGSTQFTAPVTPSSVVTCTPTGGSRYKVTATNLGWASKVQMPTWTEENGLDDAVWHNAVYEGNGVWSTYVDSIPHGGGRMTTSVYADNWPVGSVSYWTNVTSSIGVSVEPLGDARFRITATNIPWASKVQMRTWSDRNSKVVNYLAGNSGNGVWTAIINTNSHGGGRIYTDVYANGKPIGSVTYVSPEVPDPTFTAEPLGNNIFRVTAHNLYWPSTVTIPTWSEENGQDDIAWYQTHYNGFGKWTAVINASAHGGGYMISHIYADGRPVGAVTYVADYKDSPKVSVAGIGGSRFRVTVRDVYHAKGVQIATWNETAESSNTIWSQASYAGRGVWTAELNAADLGTGKLISNVYVDGEYAAQTYVIHRLSA